MSAFIKNTSKGSMFLKFILLSLGAIMLIWYLAPLVTNKFNIGSLVGIIGSVGLIVFGYFFDNINSVFRNIILAIMALFIIIVVVPLSFNMIKYANYHCDDSASTVIVLGCKVDGDKPSKYLYDRCKKASVYLNENPNSVAILSGGKGDDEDISEAQCMENVLVQMGIDAKRLIKEDKSTSTRENIKYSAEIIKNKNMDTNVLIVTNEFHEYRTKLLCDEYNLNFHSKCSYSSAYSFLTFYTRELIALVKERVM